jgi:hypothetical protein
MHLLEHPFFFSQRNRELSRLDAGRLAITNPVAFLEARFWTTSETLDNGWE